MRGMFTHLKLIRESTKTQEAQGNWEDSDSLFKKKKIGTRIYTKASLTEYKHLSSYFSDD